MSKQPNPPPACTCAEGDIHSASCPRRAKPSSPPPPPRRDYSGLPKQVLSFRQIEGAKTSVFCRTQFEAFHCWPEAPESVAFLRTRRRHIFHVEAWAAVKHDDRDIEFILLKRDVDGMIQRALCTNDTSTWSCEQWAKYLVGACTLSKCIVSEDGENGACVEVPS